MFNELLNFRIDFKIRDTIVKGFKKTPEKRDVRVLIKKV